MEVSETRSKVLISMMKCLLCHSGDAGLQVESPCERTLRVKELLGFNVFLPCSSTYCECSSLRVSCRMVQPGLCWRGEERGLWVCADVWHSQLQGRFVQSLFQGCKLESCFLKMLHSNKMKHFIF